MIFVLDGRRGNLSQTARNKCNLDHGLDNAIVNVHNREGNERRFSNQSLKMCRRVPGYKHPYLFNQEVLARLPKNR